MKICWFGCLVPGAWKVGLLSTLILALTVCSTATASAEAPEPADE